jgi:hypothetical protein
MSHPSDYPVNFSVEYPDRTLSRASTAVRLVLAIPIILLAVLLQSTEFSLQGDALAWSISFALSGGGTVVIPVALMLAIQGKYPLWWYDWNLELLRFINRIGVYLALMTDDYPSTDEHQGVRLEFPNPKDHKLGRGMPLIKWLLAAPHYFVVAILFIGLPIAVFGAWVMILITGRYPRALFSYVEGVFRWVNRVTAYAAALVTDEYPPFRLSP